MAAGPPALPGRPVIIAGPACPEAARSDPPGEGQLVRDLDAAAGDRERPHAHVAGLLARGLGVQGQGAEPRQVGGVGDLGQGAADDHAPAGTGRLVDRVDLEGDRLPLGGGVELGPRVGPEYDQVPVEHVVDREDHRPAEVRDGQAAEVPLGQQLAALGVVEFLHLGLGHAGTSLWPDTALEARRWRGVGVPLKGPGGTGRAVGPYGRYGKILHPCCHVRPLTVIAADLTTAPAELVERYASRWIVEVLFGEAPQIAGIGKARKVRSRRAVERTMQFGLLCVSLIVCWYATHGQPTADLAASRAHAPSTAASTAPSPYSLRTPPITTNQTAAVGLRPWQSADHGRLSSTGAPRLGRYRSGRAPPSRA